MDPLSALGIAGNIITFVDFSTKVVSRAKSLYHSASGATAENDELENLAKNLKLHAENTQRRPSEIPGKGPGRLSITSESVLEKLSQQCCQVADELLDALESVKVRGAGRRRKSTVQAFKVAWKQDHIDAIQRRLDRISNQLMAGLNMEQLDVINKRLRDMAVENTRLEANRLQEIDQLRQDFNHALDKLKVDVEEDQEPATWLILSDAVILQSLRFSAIDSRHQSISREHLHTFSWIFNDDSSVKFRDWLRAEDGVYWISGKPGSGKSTLMKFVAEHEQPKTCLKEWSGDKKLVTADFYFWSASTHRSPKSQRGLLRTILYQILRQCPEWIPNAYEDEWIAMTSDGRILKESRDELLTIPALLNTLKKISTLTALDTKFCFFLDGLDEYEGRPADIINLIDILRSFRNVKTCVASRPWNEFEDRFGGKSSWKLYVQDHTRADICLYVEEILGENARFQQLQQDDPQCPDFVNNIVVAADGVFLWVFLVIQSLLDGLTNSDRIKDLQERLNETPKDLRNYFETVLFTTENRYRSQTSQILSVAVHTYRELPVMAYWVIDQGSDGNTCHPPSEKPTEDVLRSRVDSMTRRLKVLSKGLLEVSEPHYLSRRNAEALLFNYKVDFLHRTVKDYLQSPEAKTMLQSWSNVDFNPDWEIFRSLVVLATMAPHECFLPDSDVWDYSLDFFHAYARRLDDNFLLRADLASQLEQLQRSVAPAFSENKTQLEAHCRDHRLYLRAEDGLEANLVIISACACFGLFNVVSERFEREPGLCNRVAKHVPVLAWSILRENFIGDWRWLPAPFLPRPSISDSLMLQLLLAQGLDPNSAWRGTSEWLQILDLLQSEKLLGTPESFDPVKMLVKHGADEEARFTEVPLYDSLIGITAKELLKRSFNADQCAVLEDIFKQRQAKAKAGRRTSTKMRRLKLWINAMK